MKRLIIFSFTVLLLSGGPVGAERLDTAATEADTAVSGSYTLILYGGTSFDDPEALAILDLEGDEYTIKPRAPEFNYVTEKGLPGNEALGKARSHVGDHTAAIAPLMRTIKDGGGRLVGYELVPRYRAFRYGRSNIVDSNYYTGGDGTVYAYIRLDSTIENELFFAGGGGERDN